MDKNTNHQKSRTKVVAHPKSKYNGKSQSLIRFPSCREENKGFVFLTRLMTWNAGVGITYCKQREYLIPYTWESALKYFKVKFRVIRRYI